MLAIAFRFPAGRYHANPWGRHVNEAEIPWPPEPWRILRGLIATWHFKVKREGHAEATLRTLVERLASAPPHYALPPASHSHTRHYLPQWKPGDTSLVYDAFARVDPEDDVVALWPTVELPGVETALLDDLLERMGYLGRAESWVDARRLASAPRANCVPGADEIDPETGEVREVISLIAPLPAAEYAEACKALAGGLKLAKKLAPTLPDDYLAAISISTSDLQKAGWSQPPAAQMLRYVRQSGALRPRQRPKQAPARRVDTVRYLLVAKPLPRIEDALRLGEQMRHAAMGLAKSILGADDIPAELSGHGTAEGRNHQHSFYLAEDADHDGRIDHVIVHSPGSFSEQALGVLERLRQVRTTEGAAWTLVLELTGERAARSVPSSLLASADVWVSVTPYLHPWHLKKNLDTAAQVRRESLARGWPAPIEIEPLPVLRLRGRALRTLQFRRFRSKRGLVQPDTHGSFLRIRFAEPVAGPIALGFGCHFGLGLFRPAGD